MPMASDVNGSMSVTFLSILTKAAENKRDQWYPPPSGGETLDPKDILCHQQISLWNIFWQANLVNGGNNRAQDHSAFRKYVIDDTTEF
jgi:hypothetical protein